MNDKISHQAAREHLKLTPERIFNLFFKYGLSYIPLIKQRDIQGYISAEKTRIQANKTAFFESRIEVNLKYIFENIEADIFFEDLDRLGLKEVPYIDSEKFIIRFYSCSEFNSIFRPVRELRADELFALFRVFNLPFYILNSHYETIYQNEKGKLFLKTAAGFAGHRKDDIFKVLPLDFLKDNTPDAEKNYKAVVGRREYCFRVCCMDIKRGRVWGVTILN